MLSRIFYFRVLWDNNFLVQSTLNPPWHVQWAHVSWRWETEVGLGCWPDEEDGMRSAYQFWKSFYQNASASAEQKWLTLSDSKESQSISGEKKEKRDSKCGKEIKREKSCDPVISLVEYLNYSWSGYSMLHTEHLQMVNIDGTITGTVNSIWEATSSAHKTVNM